MDDFTEQAVQIVKLVRAYSTTSDEAVALVVQAMKTAYSGGQVQGFRDAHESALRSFDKIVGGPQTEAVERLGKAGA